MKNEKENENSEKQSFATSPVAVKRDKLIQTKFDKYAISAKTENIILRNENFKNHHKTNASVIQSHTK